MAATQDRVPTVYIENGYVDGLDTSDPIEISYQKNFEGQPTGKNNPELLSMMWHHGHNSSIVNGIPRIGFMKGGDSAKWSDIDMADHFLNKVKLYVKSKKEKPFFLYYGMQQPHVPRTPHPRFIGATSLGPRGDVIAEADWCIGELIKTLNEENIIESDEKKPNSIPEGVEIINMPRLSDTMEEGTVAKWNKKIGALVNAVSYTHLRAHET